MGLIFWDAALRGGAITLFALLSFLFVRDWRTSLTARMGAITCLGAVAYTVLIAIDAAGPTVPWRLPFHLISLATPALFWLFALSWFDDDFRLRKWHIATVVLVVVAGFTANYLYFVTQSRIWFVAIGWRTISTGLVVAAIVTALRGWKTDLVESRRRARLALSLAIGAVILWIVFAELPLRNWPPPVGWRVVNAASLFLLAAVLAATMLGWRDRALLSAPAKPSGEAPRPETDDAPLLARLDTDMRHERLYRQDGLTITAVAARMGVPEYRLRRAINQGLGARNFNAYLNGFRIGEAADALADPTQREVPILTIAMDAGFGSLAPFNRAFRDVHACTPTEYRARASMR
ncbi:AraC family transcriptional regulator [Sphingomonas sp. SUN039]|uniref:AraC family transcriptional regulator n=1 Tax=Sphingomonas sp. SUN039 TaxID=2937787 RepID=UPI0021647D09|nr:AraC family transcriptional regulator [Sphingomonas sp. SUN039]UVO55108.1 AraC family transcriptional regulator [Sphingomonas sp. SUN039]